MKKPPVAEWRLPITLQFDPSLFLYANCFFLRVPISAKIRNYLVPIKGIKLNM
jgi:hypothetical protein